MVLPMSGARVLRLSSALDGEELARVADTFKTLSDPTRLRLLSVLADGDSSVNALCARVAMSQPAVSHQLRLLRAAHLVRARRVGREVYYAIDDHHVMELVAQARSHAGHAAPRSAPRRAPGRRGRR
jgi:DNA-binding transcriptional ArsR family regulator